MAESLIFVFTQKIQEGKLDDVKQYIQEVDELVETKEPQLIAFVQYVDPTGSEITSIHIHPDSESMEFHMEVAAQHISESARFLRTEKVLILGSPSDRLLGRLQAFGGTIGQDLNLAVKGRVGGFTRFPAVAART